MDPLDPSHPRVLRVRHVARFGPDAPVPGARHLPFEPRELALEGAPARRLASVNVRMEDKAVFDAMQGLLSFHRGRSLTQSRASVPGTVLAQA